MLILSVLLLLSNGILSVSATLIIVQDGENLQQAMDDAAPGDTLQVESGTYVGNFVVRKPLTLLGNGMPVLDGQNTLNHDTLTLIADGIRVEGFVVTRAAGAGINVSSRGNVIRGNEVVNNGQFGISVRAPENLLESNICSETSGNVRNGIGIYLSAASGSRVINNTILSSGKNGIQISYSSSLLLEGIRIDRIGGRASGGHGIRLENSALVTLRDTQISDCLTDGIYLYNASHGRVEEVLLDNTTTGISLQGTDNVSFDRVTVEHQRVGMDISTSGSGQLVRVFRSSFLSSTLPVRVTDSVVEWNSTLPLPYRFDGQYYENYTGNYWDTYHDADENGDGIGDRAFPLSSVHTDFYPLVASPDSYEWYPIPPDTNPPGPVTNLSGTALGPYSLEWTWQDPPDPDLHHLVLFLNGTHLENLSPGIERITLETLLPATVYTLGVATVDLAGNENPEPVEYTGITDSLPDPSPTPEDTVTPVPSETETPTVTMTSEETSPAPSPTPRTTRSGRVHRNTRYIPPPPSPEYSPSPALTQTMEEPRTTERESTPTIPSSPPPEPDSPWTAGIPVSTIFAPLALAGILGYLFLWRNR